MLKIRNLANSPYRIHLADGSTVMLPAMGEIVADVHHMHVPAIRHAGFLIVEDVDSDPLDHDRDGRKGGSLPADGDKDTIAKLRADYQEIIGKRPFPGWGADELQKRIGAALEA